MNILSGIVVTFFVTQRRRALFALLLGLVVVLAACGSSSTPTETAVGSGVDGSTADAESGTRSPVDAAESNLALLEPADDARDHEVLDVRDGSIATLRDAVAGDRPVLIWFWAPH